MREILFRGKRISNNKWVTGFYLERYSITGKNPEGYIFKYDTEYNVQPDTVDQFIGYADRKGNLIFENDIIEFTKNNNSKEKYLIWFNGEGQHLTAVPIDEHLNFNGNDYWNSKCPAIEFNYAEFTVMLNDFYGDFKNIEVIGNLHDNPNLLSPYNSNTIDITSLNSKWIISSDGYYPYCPNCHYRPEGELKRFCDNCGMDMLGE